MMILLIFKDGVFWSMSIERIKPFCMNIKIIIPKRKNAKKLPFILGKYCISRNSICHFRTVIFAIYLNNIDW